ncbi:DUF4426 domain-containing protein [Seongchinamella sediminis]|uniref:DUF4426 domain-containing protein n=1 Tax=Seongchinamella sediminis TaxID=2283635 RepID=A0A3L7DU51_9GAMM|nr:DUF4426 domain-containing protein [Seongchinamella sediminis]RLQ20924.1 DUF4426 domain-containing protein [Seongchinamella sediminis]
MYRFITILFTVIALQVAPAQAQQSQSYGPYELHYSVVNTTFIEPEVAAAYGIVRGKDRAILNLSVREKLPEGGDVGRPMQLKGSTRDLLQKQEELEFQEVREGPAIYYIAEIRFLNEEHRFFEIFFRPEGATETYTFELKHKMYED